MYRWLRVAENPRYQDIVKQIKELTVVPPTQSSLDAISGILKHLGERVTQKGGETGDFNELKEMAWLPARNELSRWFCPNELNSVFEEHLFSSQGRFLSVPVLIQRDSARLLDFLGIVSSPKASQVVDHLVNCSETKEIVSHEVYPYLNRNEEDLSLDKLKDKACLLLPDNTYVRPTQVFWRSHPFGRFASLLGPKFIAYDKLLSRLNVQPEPNHAHAIEILKDIVEQFEREKLGLNDEDHSVLLTCWRMLERALNDTEIIEDYSENLKNLRVIPDIRKMLEIPGRMFFEDRAGLASDFEDLIKYNVITRHEGAWRAMAAAGVRPLSDMVETKVVERTDPLDNKLILQRIRERRLELLRVSQSQFAGIDISIIEKLGWQSVTELKIQRSLRAFGQEHLGEPKLVPAHFQRKENLLLFVRHDGQPPPWASIARELALALCPDMEPGRLAPGIKEVLGAESGEHAGIILDELGFSPAEEAPTLEITDDKPIIDFGGDDDTGSGKTETEIVIGPERPKAGDDPEQESGDTDEANLGTGVLPPSSPPEDVIETKRDKQGRLVTYVYHGDKENIDEDSEKTTKRTAVDQAGVGQVMEYERQQGRYPREMPPNNPGYDIESKNDTGKIIRYIEVKSMSGYWGRTGAAMTNTQFDKARKEKELFWLYVVELAEQDDWKIYRLQNPARRVNRYFYDHNWRALAEEDGKIKENQEEVT